MFSDGGIHFGDSLTAIHKSSFSTLLGGQQSCWLIFLNKKDGKYGVLETNTKKKKNSESSEENKRGTNDKMIVEMQLSLMYKMLC